MFPKSIRWRVQLWHGCLLMAVVGVLVVGFYAYERRVRLREVDAQLHALITPLVPRLAPPPGPPGGRHEGRPHMRPPHHADEEPPQLPEGFYYVVWSRDGEVQQMSANAPQQVTYPLEGQPGPGSVLRSRNEFRELTHRVRGGEYILLGTSTAPIRSDLRVLAIGLTFGGLGVIVLGLLGGWWLTGRTLRPIEDISSAARKIADGDLSRRIPVKDPAGELGQLSQVLNSTFERLEQSFEQQVRFTADASHELRTPVAVILTQIQLALSRDRSPDEYKQTLQTCERAAERMRSLINQLLELARVDAGEETLVRERCDLARVIHDAAELVQPLARQKNSTISQSLQSVSAKVDSMKMGQVLINLLNNAVHHNTEGTQVCVSLQATDGSAVIRVSDNGSGIPAEALPHLFDRFYRVDKARSRGKGNSGLGLAICKAIVEAHRGTISVKSGPGKGTEFMIQLPLVTNRTHTSSVSLV